MSLSCLLAADRPGHGANQTNHLLFLHTLCSDVRDTEAEYTLAHRVQNAHLSCI